MLAPEQSRFTPLSLWKDALVILTVGTISQFRRRPALTIALISFREKPNLMLTGCLPRRTQSLTVHGADLLYTAMSCHAIVCPPPPRPGSPKSSRLEESAAWLSKQLDAKSNQPASCSDRSSQSNIFCPTRGSLCLSHTFFVGKFSHMQSFHSSPSPNASTCPEPEGSSTRRVPRVLADCRWDTSEAPAQCINYRDEPPQSCVDQLSSRSQ